MRESKVEKKFDTNMIMSNIVMNYIVFSFCGLKIKR